MSEAKYLYDLALLALPQVIGDKKKNITPLIPISRSAWWAGIKTGKYPAPVRISTRRVAWKASDIIALIERMNTAGVSA